MKHLIILIALSCLVLQMVTAEEVKPARIHGQIKDFKGGVVTMVYYPDFQKRDTLQVAADGTFDYTVILEQPARATLSFKEYKCSIDLFIENGMDAELTISFKQKESHGMMIYDPVVDYQGDNADCTKFIGEYMNWSLFETPWPFTRLDTLSFAEYRELYLEDVDAQKAKLMKVKSMAFREMMADVIDGEIVSSLFRFAWSKAEKDAVFKCWAESLDRNNPQNIYIAGMYLRYYIKEYPVEGADNAIRYLNALKLAFSNQEIIDIFADEYIVGYLEQAPDNMEDVLVYYKTISRNEKGHHVADSVYNHYKGLKQGSQALDFEMTDTEGKTFRLSDFRGKAVYIDVWATWCGPCCAEIPHMEKLAAHYANNKDIELISVSIDDDKAAWEKKLAEDKPKWKQFICLDALNSQLCKNYSINGIPRFLFFDKDGKVISLDAPRPSNENIIEYIDQHLSH